MPRRRRATSRALAWPRSTAVAGRRPSPRTTASDHVAEYEDLLERPDVDGVLIALPHALHRPFVEQAARARKHVLVEKPLARDVAECDSMIDEARVERRRSVA